MNIDYPWHFDNKGRTATTGDNEHIRDMLEQLIFTSPGERVNRPELGTGVMQRVFAPNSPEIAAALQFTMQAAIQRWLGDLIELQGLMVESREALQLITIQYTVRRRGQDQVATLTREV
jgi:phage baseplate assembly protein W